MDRDCISWKGVFAIVIFCLGMYFIGKGCSKDVSDGEEIVRSIVTDTVYVTRVDTVYVTRPVVKERIVVDTVYVETEKGSLSLPLEQLRYEEKGRFEAWVTGFHVSLDSVKLYDKVVERTVTRTVRTEAKQGYSCVPYMGFKTFEGTVSPNIGLMLETPKSWVLGAEIGYSKVHKTYWGVNIGHRFGK